MNDSTPRFVERYYTVPELAVLLQFSASWVRRMVKSGAFERSVIVGKDIRIPASSVNAFLDEHAVVSIVPVAARTTGELIRKVRSANG